MTGNVTLLRNTPSTAGNSMTSSERPSPEPILKKEAPPAVLGGRQFWKCSGSPKCLELQGLGDPSRTLDGNSRKSSESISGVFPEFFRNFFRKVPAVLGVWPNYSEVSNRGWREGVGDKRTPKKNPKSSPEMCPPSRGHREKGIEKRPESLAFKGFRHANPLCPPTPFRNF